MISGRRVALALIEAVQRDSPSLELGLAELRAVSAIAHPNILGILDFGFHGDTFYVVTEMLEGMPLSRRLAEGGRLPVERSLDWVRQIAAALAAAHAVGILHGALTPDDVYLVPDAQAPGGERIKVANFGIATARGREAVAHSATVDRRTDVYALGILAYEMLAGQPPSLGADPIVSPALRTALLRAVAEDPAARFDTAAELVAALSAGATSTPTQVKPRPVVPDKPLYLDENVQFSLFRPRHVVSARWYPLLVFAHLAEAQPGEEERDPQGEVTAQARQILGDLIGSFDDLQVDSSHAVPHEGQITFVPVVPGVQFNPPSRTFLWEESVHREEFRLRADASLEGKTVRGSLTVFLGTLILADIPLVIAVHSTRPAIAPHDAVTGAHARPYRLIFASYSHKDEAIVAEFERHVEASALGDRYLRDCRDLRVGEVWQEGLVRLIEQADVFQLFWSSNSMHSVFVRREWEHALGLGRQSFVRPVYWEEPLPCSADGTLPPPTLRNLHFQRVAFALPGPPGPQDAAFGELLSSRPAAPPPQTLPPVAAAGHSLAAMAEAAEPTPVPTVPANLPSKRALDEAAHKRARRWPFATGLLAAAGLALFLLGRGTVGPTPTTGGHTVGTPSSEPMLPTLAPRPSPETVPPMSPPDAAARRERPSTSTHRTPLPKPRPNRIRPQDARSPGAPGPRGQRHEARGQGQPTDGRQ